MEPAKSERTVSISLSGFFDCSRKMNGFFIIGRVQGSGCTGQVT
jgi:hypothetical protein